MYLFFTFCLLLSHNFDLLVILAVTIFFTLYFPINLPWVSLTNLCVCVCVCAPAHACVLSGFSGVRLFATLWTVARQAPLSWDSLGKNTGVVPCPPPGDLPNAGIEPTSLKSPVLAGRSLPTETQALCVGPK